MLRDRCPVSLSVTLVYCGQTAGWIKMPLGTKVGLGLCNILLDGDPASPAKGAHQLPRPPLFGPCLLWSNGRLSQQLLSSCYLNVFTSMVYSPDKSYVAYVKFHQHQPSVYIGSQWRNFFKSYLCPPWCGASSEKCLLLLHRFLSNTDIFVNKQLQFYSNNATNLHHLTSHVRHVAPQQKLTVAFVSIQHRLVTDRQTDGHRAIANTH